jgi:AbrB family looped-hinge helix DNA binding protein
MCGSFSTKEIAMASAVLTARGQTTIPKEVRDRLKLRPGDRVEFLVQRDGTALLMPKKVQVSELKGILRSKKHVSLADMDEAVRRKPTCQ